MKWLCFAVILLAGAIVALASPTRALAGTNMTICNQTSETIEAAVGYHSSGPNDTSNILTGPFVSRGLWTITPGQCINFDNPFNARYMFWWAFNHTTLNTDAPWATNGNDYFCVPNIRVSSIPAFTFEDENDSESACTRIQNSWVSVRKVDLMVDPTVRFNGQ